MSGQRPARSIGRVRRGNPKPLRQSSMGCRWSASRRQFSAAEQSNVDWFFLLQSLLILRSASAFPRSAASLPGASANAALKELSASLGFPTTRYRSPSCSRAGTIGPGVRGSFSRPSSSSAAAVIVAIAAAPWPLAAKRQACSGLQQRIGLRHPVAIVRRAERFAAGRQALQYRRRQNPAPRRAACPRHEPTTRSRRPADRNRGSE